MNSQHLEEVAHLRGRIRQKMMEIYRRETLHKKLRKQIIVLCNYQAKNMNATVSVEQVSEIFLNNSGFPVPTACITKIHSVEGPPPASG